MNKTIPMYKRVGTVFLCLSLLCGAIIGAMAISSAASNPVKTFKADFSELTALVEDSKFNSSGLYRSTADDTAINDWVNARFTMHACRESSGYAERVFLGQSTYAIDGLEPDGSDALGGEHYWQIAKDGGVRLFGDKTDGQLLRKNDSFTLKTPYGDTALLTNFELNMVFNNADQTALGGVFVAFHEANPGAVNHNTENGEPAAGLINLVAVANAAKPYEEQKTGQGGIILGVKEGMDIREVETEFETAMSATEDYNLYVKVVGTQLTAKVTKVSDSSEIYSGTAEIKAGTGSLSIGAASTDRVLKSVEVTELDADGNPVNFGTNTPRTNAPFEWTVEDVLPYADDKYEGSDANTFAFAEGGANASHENAADIKKAIDDAFDIYYNKEVDYAQMKAGDKLITADQNANFGYFSAVEGNAWLFRDMDTRNGTEVMRLITSLVPKNAEGKAYQFYNFDTTVQVRLDHAASSFVLGFRQQTPGKFANNLYELAKDQAFVAVTAEGITVAGGEDIFAQKGDANDMYNQVATKFQTAITGAFYVNVKAVGDQVYVKVYNGTTTYYEGTTTVNYTAVGTLAYGIGNHDGALGTIELAHLDDEGNLMELYDKSAVEVEFLTESYEASFNDFTGAEFKNNAYTANGKDTVAFTELADAAWKALKVKGATYFNDGATRQYVMKSANWALVANKWLVSTTTADGANRMQQIVSFVAKDANTTEAWLKDQEVTFEYRFNNASGAMLLGLRQSKPGLFVTDAGKVNTEQVLIAMTQKSIAVAGGTDITADKFYTDKEFATAFTTALPNEVKVKVSAIGAEVKVLISDLNGAKLYEGTFTVKYEKAGYTAFGVSAACGGYANIKINAYENGVRTDFTNDKYAAAISTDGVERFSANFGQLSRLVEKFSKGVYTSKAGDTVIDEWVNEKFGLYYTCEANYHERGFLGQSSDALDGPAWGGSDKSSGQSYWQITENGYLSRYVKRTGSDIMRKIDTLMFKAPSGELATVENFIAEYVIRDEKHDRGAVTLTFRAATPGKIVTGKNSMDTAQGIVSVVYNDADAKYGVSIADVGSIESGAYGQYGYVLEQIEEFKKTPMTDYKVKVKVLNDKCTVWVTSVDGATTYWTNEDSPEELYGEGPGYIGLAVSNSVKAISSISVTELDKDGNPIDFGSNVVNFDDTYEGWQPTDEDAAFEWGTEYQD